MSRTFHKWFWPLSLLARQLGNGIQLQMHNSAPLAVMLWIPWLVDESTFNITLSKGVARFGFGTQHAEFCGSCQLHIAVLLKPGKQPAKVANPSRQHGSTFENKVVKCVTSHKFCWRASQAGCARHPPSPLPADGALQILIETEVTIAFPIRCLFSYVGRFDRCKF